MKSALCASVYAAAQARELGYLADKTVYVTGTVCEEYCDGENLKLLYRDLQLRPDYCVICEPSDNVITLGHKGKAQIRITTHGISAHGSAPEKGKNARLRDGREIIQRWRRSTGRSAKSPARTGRSCCRTSRRSVPRSTPSPSACSIYLDRRLAMEETLEDVRAEMDALIAGKDARWRSAPSITPAGRAGSFAMNRCTIPGRSTATIR